MAYGTVAADGMQSSTANTPPKFYDGNSAEIGTLCRAWVQYNSSTQVKSGSFNVSSITRSAAGNFWLNFTNPMPDANYAIIATVGYNATSGTKQPNWSTAGMSTTQCQIITDGAGTTTWSDNAVNSVAIFR